MSVFRFVSVCWIVFFVSLLPAQAVLGASIFDQVSQDLSEACKQATVAFKEIKDLEKVPILNQFKLDSPKYVLHKDIIYVTGTLKLNFPGMDVWEMPFTCALDVADMGGRTLEEVGKEFGVTRERIRQIEAKALEKIRQHEKSERLKSY